MKKLKPITLEPRDKDKKEKLPPAPVTGINQLDPDEPAMNMGDCQCEACVPLEMQQNKHDRRMFLLESRIQSLEHKFETVIGYPKDASGGGGCGGSFIYNEALRRCEESNRQRALNYDVKFNSF